MGEMTEYKPGTFCWVDLATTDAEAAKAFYTELFGWNATDMPAGDQGMYTTFDLGGKNVCALYAMNEEMRAQGMPPFWQSYISVESADDSAEQATKLGGTVLMPVFDVMEVGRMTIIQDPAGAMVALWQPKQHIGAQIANVPNTHCWNELLTPDIEAAKKFYGGLFGWSATPSPGARGEYTTFKNGDREAAGMLQIQPEWGNVPPVWTIYFAVADLDATLATAQNAGGTTMMPPMDIPEVGRFAMLRDPQGGHFNVIQLNEGLTD